MVKLYSSTICLAAVFYCLVSISPTYSRPNDRLDKNCVQLSADPTKIVCICDKNQCDKLRFDWPQKPGQASLVETTKSGLRFRSSHIEPTKSDDEQTRGPSGSIKVNLSAKRQKIMGWGGAFTDAAAINMQNLSPDVRELLLQNYFGADGLGYNFGRVPIGATDFSIRPYSYADALENDFNLTKWSLTVQDTEYRIPSLKRAMEIVNSTGVALKLFATPWSPPRWMKTNHDFTRGHLIDEDRVYKSYANYLMKFFQAYREKNIEFWGATIQNEPISSFSPTYFFSSLELGNAQAIKFISKYLGPALEANGYTKENFKLMVGDDSLGFINMQVPRIMKEANVSKYISGLAFHWYTSGLLAPYNSLTWVVEAIRGKIEFVIMSEACTGSMPGSKPVVLGSWERGESYAFDIIEDLKRETGAWIDWNLALDTKGGPNWANNMVDSPVIVDADSNQFYKQPMYYALAHFSRFFKPDSVYTGFELLGDLRSTSKLSFAAAQVDQSGHLVVNVLNRSNRQKRFSVIVEDNGSTKYEIKNVQVEAKSINTIVIKI